MPYFLADRLSELYKKKANVARGLYSLAEHYTLRYEEAREKVANHLRLPAERVVFTQNSTEAANIVMRGLFENVQKGDRIVVSVLEHHSNYVPWWWLAKKKGAELIVVPLKENRELDSDFLSEHCEGAKIVACTASSNVLGITPDIKRICRIAKEHGAFTVIDAAQYAPFRRFSLKEWGCDFAFFSAHKMCGPFGVGVLAGRVELLEPFIYGSEMVVAINGNAQWAEPPHKFESGTPPVIEAIIFGEALDYLYEVGWADIERECAELARYLFKRVSELPFVRILSPLPAHTLSFTVDSVHPHDVAALLDSKGVCVRSGHHCALPIHRFLNVDASVRASIYFYNSYEDIDALVEGLEYVKSIFGR